MTVNPLAASGMPTQIPDRAISIATRTIPSTFRNAAIPKKLRGEIRNASCFLDSVTLPSSPPFDFTIDKLYRLARVTKPVGHGKQRCNRPCHDREPTRKRVPRLLP
jgi:hypothetical protein